ncbi:DUF1289 domain-containing protein [Aestuariibacter halophilus]|uniref:DUF1289 domain-containing protein n=1 Tax=Fluctibacter halophilus TaxID=226011 RepID=A0ABS8G7N4_9ALTE|nr:DUF1289 domain-containing protein [Aestuariibacter halophilus]MCC2615241.1 DUF1289 domain-containing protein [Aestuariibacter halophilus]
MTNTATETSPCIGQCCLDDNDICVGCCRHLDEITGWTSMSDEQRKAVKRQCEVRLKQRPANPFNIVP